MGQLLGLLLRGAGIVVPWWGRWLAIAALVAAWSGWIALKVHARDEREFDAFKAEVKAAGDRQNEITRQTIEAHKQLKEISDAEARTAAASRDAALERVRALQRAGADRRIVPAAPAGAAGGDRVCFSREELDRGLRSSLARFSERLIGIAEEGQRGSDIAAQCRDWARRLMSAP